MDGVLGEMTRPGVYVDNDIPGAEDADEAYDTRRYPRGRWGCTPLGTVTYSSPRGLVTHFVDDPSTATFRTDHGAPVVNVDGATTCVIVPRVRVTTVDGTRSVFQWYDACCPLDCWTMLDHVKDEQVTESRHTPLTPLVSCVTDWPKWALDKLVELLKAGVGMGDATGTVTRLLSLAKGGDGVLRTAVDVAPSKRRGRVVPDPEDVEEDR